MSRGLKPLDPNKQRRLSVRESLGKALARLTWGFAHPLAGRGKPGTDEIRGKHGIGHYTGGRDMTAT
jgi:hypothetical protein